MVRGPAVPRKTVDAVFAQVEAAIARVPVALKERTEALEAIREEERYGEVVEIDANVLIELIRAAKEIAAMKAKQSAKMARREAVATVGD